MADNAFKKRARQSLVDAYENEDPQSLSGSLERAFGNKGAPQAPMAPPISEKAISDAATRNALQHKKFMLEQIAAERARGPVEMPEDRSEMPPMDPNALSDLANRAADQQMYPNRFQNMKKMLKQK